MTASFQLVALLVVSVSIFQSAHGQSPVCDGNCGHHFGQVQEGCVDSGPDCKCKSNGKGASDKFCEQYDDTQETTCSCSVQPTATPASYTLLPSTLYSTVGLSNASTTVGYGNASIPSTVGNSSVSANETEVPSKLIETLENCTLAKKTEFGDLSDAECSELEILIVELKEVVKCSCSIKQKMKECGQKLKKFLKEHVTIAGKIRFVQIEGFGYVDEFCYQSELRQIRGTDELTALNSTTDSYPLVDSIEKAASESSDAGFIDVCLKISFRVQYVLALPDFSEEQKQGACKEIFENVFAENPQYEDEVQEIELEISEGEVYGTVSVFLSACEAIQQTRSLAEVVGGSPDQCELIKSLSAILVNPKYSTTQKSQCKQLRDKCIAKFSSVSDIEQRIVYFRDQCFELYKLVPNVKTIIDTAMCNKTDGSEWGPIVKITTVANWQEMFGCGNLSEGVGKLPSCGDRLRLIEVNETTNGTIYEESNEKCVKTWTPTAQLQYSSTRNSIKSCIRSLTLPKGPCAQRLQCIADVILKTYSNTVPAQKKKLLDCQIKGWYKNYFFTLTSDNNAFCGCASQV